MHPLINSEIQKLTQLLQQIQGDTALMKKADSIANACVNVLKKGKKILFAGNGGSAADSQHLAAELVSRLRYNRPGLAAIALTTDTSALTAIGNDYSFENLFARQIEAIGQPGDLFIGISTSGKSPNILKAFDAANHRDMITVGFSGQYTDDMEEGCDYLLSIPSRETPKIQECHILFGHIICAIVEDVMFGAEYDPMYKKQGQVA